MSKTIFKKASMAVLSVITFICVTLGCVTLVGSKTANAENAPLFQMQDGASVSPSEWSLKKVCAVLLSPTSAKDCSIICSSVVDNPPRKEVYG